MATPEGKTKEIVKKFLKTFVESGDLFYYMPVQGKFSSKGIPDFMITYMGITIGCETKADGKEDTVTELQKKTIESIKKAGGYACVVSNKNNLSILEEIMKEILLKSKK